MRIERYLRELQFAGRQFAHGIFQANAADVAVRRNSHRSGEFARKVEGTVACAAACAAALRAAISKKDDAIFFFFLLL